MQKISLGVQFCFVGLDYPLVRLITWSSGHTLVTSVGSIGSRLMQPMILLTSFESDLVVEDQARLQLDRVDCAVSIHFDFDGSLSWILL